MAGTRCRCDHLRAGVHGRNPCFERVSRLGPWWWAGEPHGRAVRATATDGGSNIEGAGDLQRYARATACRASRDRAADGRDSTSGGWAFADGVDAGAVAAVSAPPRRARATRPGPQITTDQGRISALITRPLETSSSASFACSNPYEISFIRAHS